MSSADLPDDFETLQIAERVRAAFLVTNIIWDCKLTTLVCPDWLLLKKAFVLIHQSMLFAGHPESLKYRWRCCE